VATVFPAVASARVFNFKEAGLAAYLRGTGGQSAVGQDPFGNSSGTDTVISEETGLNYSGEIGVQWAMGDKTNLRLGAEAIQHRPVSEAKGANSNQQERFTLESEVFIFNPNLTLEYVFKSAGSFRYYGLIGAGWADVTVDNHYQMTALGTSELGVTDFYEKMHATAYSGHIGGGIEALFTDNVTASLDMNYRYLKVPTLKYKGDTTSIVAPGGVGKGEEVLNQEGGKRSLDLGGFYIGITFRFYLRFL